MDWHLLSASETARRLNTSPSGIDQATLSERLKKYGKNEIAEKKKKTVLQMLLHQLADFMILILVAAAIISGLLGDVVDTVVILAIVVINALVGFVQEYRAERAIEALKKMAAVNARVIREGKNMDVSASGLVPGDVVVLEAGNIIPADVRFFETHQLKTDESALTGESFNVVKVSGELLPGDHTLGDRVNMGFKGTSVTNGRALAYVVATGMHTELGRIAGMIQTGESSTPLQKRLAAFGKKLSLVVLIICVVILVFGLLRGEALLNMLLTTISLAVAAIPEALPALVTVALALGAKRLVKSKALIRKLPAVETLGSVTYICTDKTGTLTINRMTVQEVAGTLPEGSDTFFPGHDVLMTAMALNNDVSKEGDDWLGDSTEVALVKYADKNEHQRGVLEKKFPRVAEIPFDSDRKRMTTIHRTGEGVVVITKGAVDLLLTRLEEGQKHLVPELEKKANEMANRGFRVLGYAVKKMDALPDSLNEEQIESSLSLVGFAGMIDPPREEVKQAVAQCQRAGVIPVMITGDHQLTAKAIATQLGIVRSAADLVVSGRELEQMSEKKFDQQVEKIRVYARVSPEQKLKIVRGLQGREQYVAMTGDGVNDAPALKNADIGIAMGINGTEVSKEASHMILLDDNFATIVVAIKHGRQIFDNILKFVKYIMTGNSGEIWAIFLAPFFGLPIPLLAIHILWINLVTDGLPGLALAYEKPERDIMKRPPRDPRQNIFSREMSIHILWVGLLMGVITIAMQAWAISNHNTHWQTMAFTVLCLSQMGHVVAIRSESESIFRIGIFSNKRMLAALLITIVLQLAVIYVPVLNPIFRTQPLTLPELVITLLVSSVVFWAIEIEKLIRKILMSR